MIVLFLFLGAGVLAVVALVIGILVIASNPTVQEVAGAVGGMVNAPGRKELMDAGCEMAMVMDMRSFAKLAQKDPNADPEEIAKLEKAVFVSCMYLKREPSLDCPDVAKTYGTAVPDGAPEVTVVVQAQGRQEPVCAGFYDVHTGVRLGEPMRAPERRYEFGNTPDDAQP
jgi:hypothetical protein